MSHILDLKAGITEIYLEEDRELRIRQVSPQGIEGIVNGFDVVGNTLFVALARLVYEHTGKFPRKEEVAQDCSNIPQPQAT